MPIKPTPIQLIRARFIEITEWRSRGVTWAEICNQLQSAGLKISTRTLTAVYQREFKRRNFPSYIAAAQWALTNNVKVTNLREQGASWLAILDSVPPQPANDGAIPTLNMLITEYELVASRRIISMGDPLPQRVSYTDQSTSVNAAPVPQPSLTMPEVTPAPQPATTQSQEAKGPFTGQLKDYNAEIKALAAKEKAEEEKMRQKRERQASRKSVFCVEDDPGVSVAELRAQYDEWIAIYRERAKLYREIPEDDEGRSDEKSQRERLRAEANDMTNGYYKLINARPSHRLTTRSKLCVLATAALACGAYVLAETDAPDAIRLCGFDRPDSIAGLTEIPDPVIIRPNLTQDEISRREAACHNDMQAGIEAPTLNATSHKRLLAEALILGKAYEFRHNGWIRYDEIVVLSGCDIPSPSLCGHPPSRTELTLAPPLSASDPKKDDYPSDHQCDLAREQLKGDWL